MDRYRTLGPDDRSKLRHPFSHHNLSGKARNKAEFQEEYGFRVDERIPLLTVVSRLVNKGIDIILDISPKSGPPWRFAILGTGDVLLEQRIREMAVSMPERVAAILKYDDAIAHEIYASGDLYLMPSLYGACRLSQMFAMRYGNIGSGLLAVCAIRSRTTPAPEEATGFSSKAQRAAKWQPPCAKRLRSSRTRKPGVKFKRTQWPAISPGIMPRLRIGTYIVN